MESRKIGLMNYLQGRKRETEHRLWTQQRKERIGQAERVALKHTLPDENRSLGGNHCIIQGAQPGVLCDDLEGWDIWVGGGSGWRESMYTHG